MMAPQTKKQVRTCLFCRLSAKKNELLRLVFKAGVVVSDENAKGGGRGAYVHRRPECLRQLVQVGKLAKALKIEVGKVDVVALKALQQKLLADVLNEVLTPDVSQNRGATPGRGPRL